MGTQPVFSHARPQSTIYMRVSRGLTAVVATVTLPVKVGVSVTPLYHLRHKVEKRVRKLIVFLNDFKW
jgi:hypothetical protein